MYYERRTIIIISTCDYYYKGRNYNCGCFDELKVTRLNRQSALVGCRLRRRSLDDELRFAQPYVCAHKWIIFLSVSASRFSARFLFIERESPCRFERRHEILSGSGEKWETDTVSSSSRRSVEKKK